jgi:threonine/homoserine/homoserine lactone efflux protein
MELLWNGIKFGLALSLLVGPIVFTLIQSSIEQGFRAGWTVGLGIWSSDFLYVTATYYGISYLVELTKWDGFEFFLGLIGGFILISFGAGALILRPPAFDKFERKAVRYSSYLSLWLKGFLINTLNPFTVFFWIGVSGMIFTEKSWGIGEARWFYGGMLASLIVTDTIKVALAKMIRPWLKPKYILWMRRIVGMALVIFGVILIIRASTTS